MLADFIPAKPIYLELDTSGFAIAGIILQQQDEIHCTTEDAECSAKGTKLTGMAYWHLVVFWSQSTSSAEWNFTVGDQEMLPIVMSCCIWHLYLEGLWHLV